MPDKYRLGLRGKATLGLAALILLSLIVTSISSYLQSRNVAELKVIELEQSKQSLLKHEIEGALKEHQNILMSLHDVPPVQAILRARINNGIDPQSEDSLDVWSSRLSTIFAAFLANHKQYLQIRFIDAAGEELVRVESNSNESVHFVPAEGLQNKSGALYVTETLKLNQGEVYFSDVSLNREHGVLQVPHVPVLRLATPVHNADGEISGLIVINLATERMFSDVQSSSNNGVKRFIVDERGDYIKHPDEDKTFSTEQDVDYNFHNIEPELAALTKTQDKFMRRFEKRQEIAGFQKIYFSPQDHSRYWLLTLHVPEAVVFSDIAVALNNMLFVGLVIGLFSLVLVVWFVSRRIVDPVLDLAAAAERLHKGDLTVRLDESRAYDEFRTLYKAINSFAKKQQDATGELKREIESQTRRLSAVIDNVVDGIITIDERGSIETFNPAARRIFGYSNEEVIGQNVKVLMPEPFHSEHDGYLDHHINTGEKKIIGIGREVIGRRKDGSTFPMELAVSDVIIDNVDNVRHFVGITRDITDRKQVEEMQKEFISTVSHELRTPLTSISGSLGLILGGVVGELPEKAHALLTIANNNSERLINLINDILDIEKISAGKMQYDFAVMNLIPIIRLAVESNKGYADKLNVSFKLDVGAEQEVMVRIDQKRMEQVMSNLLSNAAKYSPTREIVDIAVVRGSDHVRISVHDQGKGIPEDFKSKIFSKFCQADSSDTREKGGTGLGLNITKSIVEQHQGTIGFESEEGGGTTFYVDLPRWLENNIADKGEDETAKLESPRVLIVEDDKDVSTLLSMMLEEEGYQFHQAYDYQDAVSKLEAYHYDAITLDLMIPGGSGITLLRELRSNELTRKLPVVVVSAMVNEGQQEVESDSFEMVDWIEKPIDTSRLVESIRSGISQEGKEKSRILHVEDDPDIASVVDSLLGETYSVRHAETLFQARQCVSDEDFDLVLIDVGLPDGSGLDLIPLLHTAERQTPVVVFSAQDVPADVASKVMGTLVKSKTANEQLMQQIKLAISRKR